MIVPLGTIASSKLSQSDGSLALPKFTGSSNLQVNIYFDTNGDGQPFAFNSDGVYEGTNGDTYITTGNQPVPAATVTADQNANQGTGTHIWAWVGIDSATAGQTTTGYVTTVNGAHLVTQAAAVNPVTGLKATAKYTSLSATWKASSGATGYKVTVTTHTHKGTVTVASATVTGTSYHLGRLAEKTSYAIHVLALPAARGQHPATVYVTTK